jgi:sucrose-6-phosphate hydrolase SacC (GH32 family)
MFTNHDMAAEKAGSLRVESQALAFSIDSGRTWEKSAGNPVIPNPGAIKDFRDLKLVRDAAPDRWLVALPVGDHAEFYGRRVRDAVLRW